MSALSEFNKAMKEAKNENRMADVERVIAGITIKMDVRLHRNRKGYYVANVYLDGDALTQAKARAILRKEA